MATTTRGNLFPAELVPGLIQKTIGASAIAKLCSAQPIAFNGQKEFTFTMDREIDVVAESGAKSVGGSTVGSITIVPIKVEYSSRVSDEFMYASEEYKLGVLEAFTEGWSRKLAKGLDLMAFHGINPRTAAASTVIGPNNFADTVTNIVTIASGDTPDENIEAAIALVQNAGLNVDGLVLASAFKAGLAAQTKQDGSRLYPDLAWGNAPSTINGLRVETTPNLAANSSLLRALVGDWHTAFKWGYAKEMPIEVIEYGNPDNDQTNGDLKGHNQVLIRAEAFLGWGILDPRAFAVIKEPTPPPAGIT